jgi:hypothetical protein
VAEAENSHTPETWETLQEVYPLVLKICLSPSRAGPWLAELIFVKKRVRVHWQEISSASTSAEIFFRSSRLPELNFSDNSAETWELPSRQSGVVGICPVTMLGIEVVREDIAALRPGVEAELAQSKQSNAMHFDHVTIGNVNLPPSFMSRLDTVLTWLGSWVRSGAAPPVQEPAQEPESTRKNWRPEDAERWLDMKKQTDPRQPGESKDAYARRLYPAMESDFGDKIPWTRPTLRRRMDPW